MSGLGKFKQIKRRIKMYNKRGFFGLVGIVCFIAGVFGFLTTVEVAHSKTFIEWLGDIWVYGWLGFSFIALLAMTVETKERIIALVATFMWIVLFFCAVIATFSSPHTMTTLSTSQMFAASLLLFVMPAFIAEDAKHGWD